MDRGYRFLCQAETRRLLSLLGVIVALVLVVQYTELPYSKMLSSLIPSFGKISSSQMETSRVSSELEGNNNTFDAMASSPSPDAYEYAKNSATIYVSSPSNSVQKENVNLTNSQGVEVETPSFAPQPMASLPNLTSIDSKTESASPMLSVTSIVTSVKSDAKDPTEKNGKPGSSSQGNGKPGSSSKSSKKRPSKVVSLSEMNILLQQSHASSQLVVYIYLIMDQVRMCGLIYSFILIGFRFLLHLFVYDVL